MLLLQKTWITIEQSTILQRHRSIILQISIIILFTNNSDVNSHTAPSRTYPDVHFIRCTLVAGTPNVKSSDGMNEKHFRRVKFD